MIRVLVLYPRSENSIFDPGYYVQRHLPLVREKLKPRHLEADIGVPGSAAPSPYFAVTHMVFDSRESLREAYGRFGRELNEDKSNFTDVDVIVQLGETTRFT